jgi:hypothetical protein
MEVTKWLKPSGIRERQAVTDDMNVFAHNSNKGGAIRSEEFNRSLILHPYPPA